MNNNLHSIKYHGLYAPDSERSEGDVHSNWLRFYPNGEVIGYQINAIPRTAANYLRIEKRGIPRGVIKMDGAGISFELSTKEGVVASFEGSVEGDVLVLSKHNLLKQRHTEPEPYSFYAIKKLATPSDAPTQESVTPKPQRTSRPKALLFGFPPPFEVIKVGETPTSRNGVVAVGGNDCMAVFDTKRSLPVLSPNNTIAFVMLPSEQEVAGWRVEKKADTSGIARGDYDWWLDLYAWPPTRADAMPTLSYKVSDYELITWFWPVNIVSAKSHHGRIIELKCGSEEGMCSLFLVRTDTELWRETRDRKEAIAWAVQR